MFVNPLTIFIASSIETLQRQHLRHRPIKNNNLYNPWTRLDKHRPLTFKKESLRREVSYPLNVFSYRNALTLGDDLRNEKTLNGVRASRQAESPQPRGHL